jgi:hypothetical protein
MMLDSKLERVVAALKAPAGAGTGFEGGVIDRIRRSQSRRAAAAPVAGLALLLVTGAAWWIGRPNQRTVRFEIELPDASEVALVGDFNDWDRGRAPLTRAGPRWSISVPLRSGMYRYAFLIDGSHWTADPDRPAPGDPDFGEPMSVLTVD